jgi:hypothetical protein
MIGETSFYFTINDTPVTSSDVAIIVFCVILVGVFLIGIIRKIHTGGVKEVLNDEAVLEVKKILINQMSDILHDIGLTADYETYKNTVLYEALARVRAYIDKKGGLVDTITDEISDDTIIELINEALQLSGLEDSIKEAYDLLVTNRVAEIEATEDEAAASVDDEGNSTEKAEDDESDVNADLEPDEVSTDETYD